MRRSDGGPRRAALLSLAVLPGLGILACDGDAAAPSAPGPLEPMPVAALEVMSGDGQRGAAGHPLGEYLVVRATGPTGRTLAGAEIAWFVEEGAGRFPPFQDATMGDRITTWTGEDGLSHVRFVPMQAGRTLVGATPSGDPGLKAMFVVDAIGPDWLPIPAGWLTFVRDGTESYGSSVSRFVMESPDVGLGRFVLQYLGCCDAFEFPGQYLVDGYAVRVWFDDDDTWEAEGTLIGDTLTVRYNLLADMSGFEGGRYILWR